MPQSSWDKRLEGLQKVIMKPIRFNDLRLTLIDAVDARHEPGWQAAGHRHPWFEYNYVSEGCLQTSFGSASFLTKAGSFFLIPPGVSHSNQNIGKEADDGFCLRWQIESAAADAVADGTASDFYLSFLRTMSAVRPCAIPNDLLAGRMELFFCSGSVARQQLALLDWLLLMYENWSGTAQMPPAINTREEILVRQATLYLSEYYAEPITVSELAASLNISYRHLARLFHRITGVTLIEKLNDLRMNQARILLCGTDLAIKEIAGAVGFPNEFYFSNLFRRTVFVTPSEYRRRHQNSHSALEQSESGRQYPADNYGRIL